MEKLEQTVLAPIRVLLVDDHSMVRDALSFYFEKEPDLEVVASVGTADEAIKLAYETCPDLIVMDIDMPGLLCFEAAARIKKRLPEVRLIFLTAHRHDHYIEEALKVGAHGYLVKDERAAQVVSAVREVGRGGEFFSSEIEKRVVKGAGRERKLGPPKRSKTSTLTARELEMLRYLARGMTRRDMARTLHLSPKTIDNHVQNVMKKLEMHDRVTLARFAIREGLVEG